MLSNKISKMPLFFFALAIQKKASEQMKYG